MLIQNRVEIAASQSLVWKVTEEIESWPVWSPTMTSIQRLDSNEVLTVGSIALVKQPGMPATKWTISALEHQQRFQWRTTSLGLTMTATHELYPTITGISSLLQLEVQGLIGIVLRPLLSIMLKRALWKENRGLKNYCESLADKP